MREDHLTLNIQKKLSNRISLGNPVIVSIRKILGKRKILRKSFNSWALLCAGMLLLAACGNDQDAGPVSLEQENASIATDQQQEAAELLTIVDDTGEELVFTEQVERVACVVSFCIDMLAELGMEPIAIAEGGVRTIATEPEFYGEKGLSFTSISGSFFEPNLEDIIAAKPELVIGLKGVHDPLREGLSGIVPILLVNPVHYEQSIAWLQAVGQITGNKQEAMSATEQFLNKLEEAREMSPQSQRALVMYGSDVNFSIITDSGLGGSIMKEIADYPWQVNDPSEDPYGEGSIPYSLEKLLEGDPDAIFVQSYSFGPAGIPLSEQLAELPLWSKLKAVHSDRVIEVRSPVWGDGRGTRSLGIMLDEAMAVLYPELN